MTIPFFMGVWDAQETELAIRSGVLPQMSGSVVAIAAFRYDYQ